MASTKSIDTRLILQLALAAFLILLGIQGIVSYNSPANELARAFSGLFGGGKDVISLTIAIIDLVAGVLLALELFVGSQIKLIGLGPILVVVYWIARTVYKQFITGMSIQGGRMIFQPDFLGWLVLLMSNIIYVIALFHVSRKSA
ncbi:MAG: hypothetical protein JW881_08710 [Spirochaetales bacterium]|nr:hypothetical protein [Spirochaetales bacterium]